jgi:hypothetical protein
MTKTLRGSIGVVFFVAILALFFYARPADAAINNQINFQGKITNPNGTNVTNGSYNFTFSIYTVATLGAPVWTETKSITVNDGIFQTALGDTTALPGSVDFNGSSLFLGVQVNADPEMTPRVRLTAAPYAFNSDLLDGLDSNNLVKLAQGLQVDSSTTNASISVNKTGGTAAIMQLQRAGSDVLNIANSGAYNYTLSSTDNPTYTITNNGSGNIVTNLASTGNVVYQDNGATFLTLSNTGAFDLTLDANDDPTFTITNNGTGDVTFNLNDTGDFILQDSGVATLTVTETGATTFKNSADSTTAFLIQKAGSTVELLTVDTSNNRVYIGDVTADATGTLLVLDTKNDNATDPTGVDGGTYYNSFTGRFRCFENSVWFDCLAGYGREVVLKDLSTAASAAATNLALNTLNCVSDPNYRTITNLKGMTKIRLLGRFGGTLVNATTMRIQYSTSANPAIATGDASWATLATSAGTHTTGTYFYTAEFAIPAAAQINNVQLRACIFSGDSFADPTLTAAKLNIYP